MSKPTLIFLLLIAMSQGSSGSISTDWDFGMFAKVGTIAQNIKNDVYWAKEQVQQTYNEAITNANNDTIMEMMGIKNILENVDSNFEQMKNIMLSIFFAVVVLIILFVSFVLLLLGLYANPILKKLEECCGVFIALFAPILIVVTKLRVFVIQKPWRLLRWLWSVFWKFFWKFVAVWFIYNMITYYCRPYIVKNSLVWWIVCILFKTVFGLVRIWFQSCKILYWDLGVFLFVCEIALGIDNRLTFNGTIIFFVFLWFSDRPSYKPKPPKGLSETLSMVVQYWHALQQVGLESSNIICAAIPSYHYLLSDKSPPIEHRIWVFVLHMILWVLYEYLVFSPDSLIICGCKFAYALLYGYKSFYEDFPDKFVTRSMKVGVLTTIFLFVATLIQYFYGTKIQDVQNFCATEIRDVANKLLPRNRHVELHTCFEESFEETAWKACVIVPASNFWVFGLRLWKDNYWVFGLPFGEQYDTIGCGCTTPSVRDDHYAKFYFQKSHNTWVYQAFEFWVGKEYIERDEKSYDFCFNREAEELRNLTIAWEAEELRNLTIAWETSRLAARATAAEELRNLTIAIAAEKWRNLTIAIDAEKWRNLTIAWETSRLASRATAAEELRNLTIATDAEKWRNLTIAWETFRLDARATAAEELRNLTIAWEREVCEALEWKLTGDFHRWENRWRPANGELGEWFFAPYKNPHCEATRWTSNVSIPGRFFAQLDATLWTSARFRAISKGVPLDV